MGAFWNSLISSKYTLLISGGENHISGGTPNYNKVKQKVAKIPITSMVKENMKKALVVSAVAQEIKTK